VFGAKGKSLGANLTVIKLYGLIKNHTTFFVSSFNAPKTNTKKGEEFKNAQVI
jgi:hypothetical protein